MKRHSPQSNDQEVTQLGSSKASQGTKMSDRNEVFALPVTALAYEKDIDEGVLSRSSLQV